ncbi:uncharacterized protein LOC110434194 isoform X1 [Sorghum bicolor]|nr:uncharacterized protein LOC110434194 isoform X1 [Sorghum bicolor]|eukprot:XP_021313666.1 uncharacterized protein LOC110434194 isoform X1 [Sorghum bicolor]
MTSRIAQTKRNRIPDPFSAPKRLNSKQPQNNHRFLAAPRIFGPFPTRHGTPPLSAAPPSFPCAPLCPPNPRSRTLAGLREMDEDWELLLASPKAAVAAEPYAGGGGGGGEDDAGAIKHDYFDLGSDAKYPRRASLSKGNDEVDEEEGVDEGLLGASDNSSWVEPDPDDLLFPGRDRAALWSDSSSDGERPEVEATDPVERAREEDGVTVAAAADGGEGAVAKGGGGPVPWWKLSLDALRVWALRAARSAWSVPFAVALLGFAVLGRRLYRMRRQSKAVARVRLVLDEKKVSQFKGQSSRLNESMTMVRRTPIIKPMLPANGVTPWPVLGHL